MLKAGFRKCHRRPQHRLPLGCELRELLVAASANDKPPSWVHHPPAGSVRKSPPAVMSTSRDTPWMCVCIYVYIYIYIYIFSSYSRRMLGLVFHWCGKWTQRNIARSFKTIIFVEVAHRCTSCVGKSLKLRDLGWLVNTTHSCQLIRLEQVHDIVIDRRCSSLKS